ncbi:MAG: hypothetical protein JXA30_08915, partial [Deltaproteobacteria bacterium]|nr:hypothetical protein [Deltaproteobacteria bacterium]
VLAVPDEPARGRKPVLRDELAAVVVKQQYASERLQISYANTNPNGTAHDFSLRFRPPSRFSGFIPQN